MMPAMSYKPQWVDDLLNSLKEQSTRPQTKRFKVGDKVSMYILQRGQIDTKPIRKLTAEGSKHYDLRDYKEWRMSNRPTCPMKGNSYYAHLLGYVELTNVYEFSPSQHIDLGTDSSFDFLERWARDDNFINFEVADKWFTEQYDRDWINKIWTVIQWNGWLQRFFEGE